MDMEGKKGGHQLPWNEVRIIERKQYQGLRQHSLNTNNLVKRPSIKKIRTKIKTGPYLKFKTAES